MVGLKREKEYVFTVTTKTRFDAARVRVIIESNKSILHHGVSCSEVEEVDAE